MSDEDKWRQSSSDLIEIGEALAEIKRDFVNVRATLTVSDRNAIISVDDALRASKRLTRALDRLSNTIVRKS